MKMVLNLIKGMKYEDYLQGYLLINTLVNIITNGAVNWKIIINSKTSMA